MIPVGNILKKQLLTVRYCQSQPSGDGRQHRTLHQDRGYGDEKNEIKNKIGFREAGDEGISGKNDRYGAPESHPGEEYFAPPVRTEEQQRPEDADGAGDQDKEGRYQESGPRHGPNPRREDQQTQGKKKNDLHQPGNAVIELDE